MGEDFDNPFGITLKNGTVPKCRTYSIWRFPGPRGPLEHVIAAKAVALGVFSTFINLYGAGTKECSLYVKAFRDYHLISGGTDNHLMLIDLRNKNISGKSELRW